MRFVIESDRLRRALVGKIEWLASTRYEATCRNTTHETRTDFWVMSVKQSMTLSEIHTFVHIGMSMTYVKPIPRTYI